MNNYCERAVRPFTNLRKNFSGFSSEAGARVAAIYFTFVETCKLMKKTALDFFKGFFGMTTSGRTTNSLLKSFVLIKLKKYNQAENSYNPESPVNTGALVYCHRDWMLTIFQYRILP